MCFAALFKILPSTWNDERAVHGYEHHIRGRIVMNLSVSQNAAHIAYCLRQDLFQNFEGLFHCQIFTVDPREREKIFHEADGPVGFGADIVQNFSTVFFIQRGIVS